MPATHAVRRTVVFVVATGLVHGCALTGPDVHADEAELSFSTSIAVASSHVGTPEPRYELELRAYYERADGALLALGGQRIALASVTAQSREVSLPLNIRSCVADVLRVPVGAGCPVRIVLVLWLANNGVALDFQHLGPFILRRGERTTVPDEIAVAQIVNIDVVPPAPTVPVGGTVALAARFFTTTGQIVVRPVEWRSEAPAIATVSAAGVVTGVAVGRAIIAAHWGEGQASFGDYVTVTAASTAIRVRP